MTGFGLRRMAIRTALMTSAMSGTLPPAHGQTVQVMNGPPIQMKPYVAEPGAPIINIQPGTPQPFGGLSGGVGSPDGTDTSGGAGLGGSATSVASSDALNTMLATPWGATAAANAQAVGLNPSALAATCLVESGCGANVGNGAGAQGVFQMYPTAFSEGLRTALAANPALASQIVQGPAGVNDPVTAGIAASGYLLQANLALQSAGVSSPTVLDARGYYNFGPGYAPQLALANADEPIANVLSGMSSSALAQNGIKPGETVGQWRASVSNKIGIAATQTVQL